MVIKSTLVVKLTFVDGSVLEADTEEELEQKFRDLQYRKYNSQEEFREDMVARALVWSGTEVMSGGSSRDFLYELERAAFFQLSSKWVTKE